MCAWPVDKVLQENTVCMDISKTLILELLKLFDSLRIWSRSAGNYLPSEGPLSYRLKGRQNAFTNNNTYYTELPSQENLFHNKLFENSRGSCGYSSRAHQCETLICAICPNERLRWTRTEPVPKVYTIIRRLCTALGRRIVSIFQSSRRI